MIDLPILIQWKWVEQPPSFLVIFHFYDDYSKPNLRTAEMRFEGYGPFYIYVPEKLTPRLRPEEPRKVRTVVTWAPSHSELGLLMDLLSYANIVNGFKEQVKRELKKKLIIIDLATDRDLEFVAERIKNFRKFLVDKIDAFGIQEDQKTGETVWNFYSELCPEYLDYLKEILKPYL